MYCKVLEKEENGGSDPPFGFTGKSQSVVFDFQIGPICPRICVPVRTHFRFKVPNLNLCANAVQIDRAQSEFRCEHISD
jgi:hypothetical protein